MNITFNVYPWEARMSVKTSYKKSELRQEYFYLNRDFTVTGCLRDGRAFDINKGAHAAKLSYLNGYEAKRYDLPPSFDEVTLEYEGTLSGETGSCPYVKERITPEFTFIRWETFCFPIFFKDEAQTLLEFLVDKARAEITVTTPAGYTTVCDGSLVNKRNEEGREISSFTANCLDISIAIAPYVHKATDFGNLYLFEGTDSDFIEDAMAKAHAYMNERFGKRVINADTNYASIPQGFGSMARPRAVFIDETAYHSIKTMSHLIHEFIHLGWNVPAENICQSIRFFDEAFTSYFENRVMEHLLRDEGIWDRLTKSYKYQLTLHDGDVPIAGFGERQYGDLSYTIGALCLHELSKLVGMDAFDEATKAFLLKYRHTPANLDIFCNEYISRCGTPGLKEFFDDWIYTVKGPKAYAAQ